jgi:hypothetical protein
MDIEKEIKDILFSIGKDVRIHKIDEDNMILEIDYERYTADILRIFKDYLNE